MITIAAIQNLVEEKLLESDNYLVELTIKPGNKITVLLDNDKGISIADCVSMSRYIEAKLDREKDDFELNVMSAGLSEPFKIKRQYKKNIGKLVDVVTKENKKLTGKLTNAGEEGITIEVKTKEKTEGKKTKQEIIHPINLTYNQIKETKVVILF